jgi:hypothetical protein
VVIDVASSVDPDFAVVASELKGTAIRGGKGGSGTKFDGIASTIGLEPDLKDSGASIGDAKQATIADGFKHLGLGTDPEGGHIDARYLDWVKGVYGHVSSFGN